MHPIRDMFHSIRIITSAVLTTVASTAVAQTLSLADAIELAKRNNGVVAAAFKDYEAARSAVVEARAAYFPTITPSYSWFEGDDGTGFARRTSGFSFDDLSVDARWLLLDGGQRQYNLARARNLADASELSALWTLRQTLFSVIQQYYDVLRATELLSVADAEVERTKQILDSIKKRVELGDLAAKEILQAEADYANAIVNQITRRNQVSTSSASLKAIIGWPGDQPLAELEAPETFEPTVADITMAEAIETGLAWRPDLQESKKRQAAGRYSLLTAEQNASIDWTLSLSYSKNWEPGDTYGRSLTFLVSFPLFDGGLSRERVRQSRLSLEAGNFRLQQQERNVRSEIEAVFLSWEQNHERLAASEAALKAAELNYKAATESQAVGAGTILEVTNARSALVIAETNYVQAVYDYLISEVQLKLVMGSPVPGEDR